MWLLPDVLSWCSPRSPVIFIVLASPQFSVISYRLPAWAFSTYIPFWNLFPFCYLVWCFFQVSFCLFTPTSESAEVISIPCNGPRLRKDSADTDPAGTLHHSSCPAVRPHYSSSSSRVSAALVSRKAVRGSGAQTCLVTWTWVMHFSLAHERESEGLISIFTAAEPSEGFCILHLLLLAGSKRDTWTPSWPLRSSISAEPTQPPDHPLNCHLLCRFLGRTPELSLIFGNVSLVFCTQAPPPPWSWDKKHWGNKRNSRTKLQPTLTNSPSQNEGERGREKPDRHTGKQATGDKTLHREANKPQDILGRTHKQDQMNLRTRTTNDDTKGTRALNNNNNNNKQGPKTKPAGQPSRYPNTNPVSHIC